MKAHSTSCVAHPRKRHVNPIRLLAALVWLAMPGGLVQAQLISPELSHELTPVDPPVTAPDFALVDLDDQTHKLGDYRGKVVMLNFWATWCPPCRREIPSMESIYQDLGESGFVVLAVNEFEDSEHVFAYMGQLSVLPNFPILMDTDSTVAQDYKVKGLPTTVLIDKQGRIVYRAVGGRDFDHEEVRKIVRRLLADR